MEARADLEERADRPAVHDDAAARRTKHAGGKTQERALSGSIAADDAEDLPLMHAEIDVSDSPDLADSDAPLQPADRVFLQARQPFVLAAITKRDARHPHHVRPGRSFGERCLPDLDFHAIG